MLGLVAGMHNPIKNLPLNIGLGYDSAVGDADNESSSEKLLVHAGEEWNDIEVRNLGEKAYTKTFSRRLAEVVVQLFQPVAQLRRNEVFQQASWVVLALLFGAAVYYSGARFASDIDSQRKDYGLLERPDSDYPLEIPLSGNRRSDW